jgi:ligand-binding sensor domain-containing protein/signal transduction histidine kinase
LRNSNISREGRLPQPLFNTVLLGILMVCLAYPTHAIAPDRLISQYIREHWGSDKGFTGGSVTAIAQTLDGYLWIGTEKGLIRFDGQSFRVLQQASPSSFPIGPIRGLVGDAQGNLWILLQNTKILRYHDGKFELGRDEAEFGITALGSRRDGTVLLSSLALGTLTYRSGKFEILNLSSELANSGAAASTQTMDDLSSRHSWATSVTPHRLAEPNSAVISTAETADGKVWLGTRDKGLFYLSEGRVFGVGNGRTNRAINCILPSANQDLWIGTDKGVARWKGAEVTSEGIPPSLQHIQVLSMIRDRDSNIWVGTARGLVRVSKDGLVQGESPRANNATTALFEDREGNLWVGGASGIERWRDSPFVTYSPSSLGSESSGPVYVDEGERAWFAPFEGGLHWLKGGKTGSVSNDSLNRDVVYSIAGSKGELWIGRQQGGLTHLRFADDGSFMTKTYTAADGLAQNSVYAVHRNRDGTVWAGTLSGGASEYRNGHFTTYTIANGMASNTVASIAESANGTTWFATPNGVSALSGGRWQVYRTGDGLPSNNVNCLLADSTGTLWIGTISGLAFLRPGADHVESPTQAPAELSEPILGIADDGKGWLWISTSNHVLRVSRDKLVSNMLSDTDLRAFGVEDGLQGTEGVKRHQSVFTDVRGMIWFSMNRGISVVDPARAAGRSAPALVHIDGVSADGNSVSLQQAVRFAEGHPRITFSYTALSLSVPERVRFRYRLEGLDKNWSNPVTERQVTYNNLNSGSYRFRVIASNSDGLWNSSESAVPFEIEPAYWQTWWFRVSSLLIAGVVILMFFRLRVLALTRQMNMRFEERLAERTRIAQELHDTLLQGFLSASMQLHVANEYLPSESPAKPLVGRVLELMGRVIDEGRNTVRGLRVSDRESDDLEKAFSEIQRELSLGRETGFRVLAEGETRPLRAVIREEVYWIGREALVNAFRHSRARNIEVELEYAPAHLRLLVRDNGSGIDPEVVRAGRDGHWGLSGMRERADRIGAKFKVLSGASAGTEVELSVPGHIAFQFTSPNNGWKWLSKLRLMILREEEHKTESEKQD